MATTPGQQRGRSYGGLDPAERDEQRRRRLLDAGLDTFGTEGYAGASVEALCASARVSTRNFYDHFANREALLIAVYDEIVQGALGALAASLASVPASTDVPGWIRHGVEVFTDYMLADPRRARVNFVEVVGASQAVEAHRRVVLGQFATVLVGAAHALQGAGWVPAWDEPQLRVAVSIVIGGIQESLTAWLAESAEGRIELAGLIDVLVQITVAAIRPPSD